MKKIVSIVAIFFVFFLCVHIGRALADVAANARIVNQATLFFNDGSGTHSVNASVTVTVAHVPGIPTLNSPGDGTIAYAGPDTPLDFIYTITAGGNGPDTYTISGTIVNQTNNGSSGGVNIPAPIELGATITTTGSSALVFRVPSDGSSDGAVNGISVDEWVMVNTEARQVQTIDDQDSGTATITLMTALSAPPGAGVPVLEQQEFTLTVDSGTVATPGTDIVVTVDTSAGSTAGSVTDQVAAIYTSGSATLTKYVRNVDDANGTTGLRSFAVGGTSYDYYTGGVTGAPGHTLEYLLLAENPGSGDITACAIADVLPTEFVAMVAGAYNGTYEIVFSDSTGGETGLTQASDGDAAAVSGADMTVQVGTVPASGSVFIVYQVTINN